MKPSDAATTHLHFEISAKSDVGVLRSVNEDRLFFDAERGLLVLADGMGGHKAGETASAIAVEVVARALTAQRLRGRRNEALRRLLRKVFDHANRLVRTASQSRAHAPGNHPDQTMGTTMALLLMNESQATIAYVGDSRVYRLRERKLELLTRDHSLLQKQIDRGTLDVEIARQSHNRHLVTRGLGQAETVEVEFVDDTPLVDDIYLICSDGLNDMIDDDEIETVLNAVGVNLALTVEQLVMIANDAGGKDNTSVILARVRAGELPARKRRGFFEWLFRR
jgi:PPM family protein phosphatase